MRKYLAKAKAEGKAKAKKTRVHVKAKVNGKFWNKPRNWQSGKQESGKGKGKPILQVTVMIGHQFFVFLFFLFFFVFFFISDPDESSETTIRTEDDAFDWSLVQADMAEFGC